MSYFACGGFYPIKKDGMKTYEFRLVHPGLPGTLPYITQNCRENLFRLSMHHSHLYELYVEEFGISAHVVRPSYEAHVADVQPFLSAGKFELPVEERDKAMAVILSEKFWEV